MKSSIAKLVEQAILSLPELADVPEVTSISTTVERTRDARYGDFELHVEWKAEKDGYDSGIFVRTPSDGNRPWPQQKYQVNALIRWNHLS